MDLSALDWICLAVLAASLLLGLWRGLIYEAFSLGGWIAAFVVARLGADRVGAMLPLADAGDPLRFLAGFALLFVLVAFLAGMVAWAVRRAARVLGLRPVDRVFGAVFGLARGLLLLLVAAFAVHALGLQDAPWWQSSLASGWLQAGLDQLMPMLPEAVQQMMTSQSS